MLKVFQKSICKLVKWPEIYINIKMKFQIEISQTDELVIRGST